MLMPVMAVAAWQIIPDVFWIAEAVQRQVSRLRIQGDKGAEEFIWRLHSCTAASKSIRRDNEPLPQGEIEV